MGHVRLTNYDHAVNWPDFLKKATSNTQDYLAVQASQPEIVFMHEKGAEKKLEKLCKNSFVIQVLDSYDEQLAELFLSKDAHLYRANTEVQINSIKDLLDEHYAGKPSWKLGAWVYYPWKAQLVHLIDPELFADLRTIRNRDLITHSEQKKLRNFNVACLGMSVGSSSAIAMTLSGISDKIKLADGAVISGSNLNRILTGVSSIGVEKATVIKRQLYEMNPFIEVHSLEGKLSSDNIADFFDKPWKVDLVVDEIDDLEMKIRVRIEARKRKIPVVMATELADSVMLDVERFDEDSNLKLFHGLAGDIEHVLDKKDMSQREWMKYATTIIGHTNVPLDMQQSLLKIGTKVVTHPQLGATAMMTGGVLAFAAKQLALGRNLPTQRKNISLDKVFLPAHGSRQYKRKHKKHTKVLRKTLNSI